MSSQSMKDDLAALLDPETGFPPRLRQICRDQVMTMLWRTMTLAGREIVIESFGSLHAPAQHWT
jgi:hypothetical protein